MQHKALKEPPKALPVRTRPRLLVTEFVMAIFLLFQFLKDLLSVQTESLIDILVSESFSVLNFYSLVFFVVILASQQLVDGVRANFIVAVFSQISLLFNRVKLYQSQIMVLTSLVLIVYYSYTVISNKLFAPPKNQGKFSVGYTQLELSDDAKT